MREVCQSAQIQTRQTLQCFQQPTLVRRSSSTRKRKMKRKRKKRIQVLHLRYPSTRCAKTTRWRGLLGSQKQKQKKKKQKKKKKKQKTKKKKKKSSKTGV